MSRVSPSKRDGNDVDAAQSLEAAFKTATTSLGMGGGIAVAEHVVDLASPPRELFPPA